jgi:ribosomal protein S18 acetylase RimI-like enzyme
MSPPAPQPPRTSTSKADITVRHAILSDVDSFPEMGVRTWVETYSAFGVPQWWLNEPPGVQEFRAGFPARITNPDRNTWVAYDEAEKKVVGYATAQSKPNLHGYIDIRAVYVLTEYQGVGIGRRLVEGVVGEDKKCRAVVETLVANESARKFHTRMGFTRYDGSFIFLVLSGLTLLLTNYGKHRWRIPRKYGRCGFTGCYTRPGCWRVGDSFRIDPQNIIARNTLSVGQVGRLQKYKELVLTKTEPRKFEGRKIDRIGVGSFLGAQIQWLLAWESMRLNKPVIGLSELIHYQVLHSL